MYFGWETLNLVLPSLEAQWTVVLVNDIWVVQHAPVQRVLHRVHFWWDMVFRLPLQKAERRWEDFSLLEGQDVSMCVASVWSIRISCLGSWNKASVTWQRVDRNCHGNKWLWQLPRQNVSAETYFSCFRLHGLPKLPEFPHSELALQPRSASGALSILAQNFSPGFFFFKSHFFFCRIKSQPSSSCWGPCCVFQVATEEISLLNSWELYPQLAGFEFS